MACEAALPDLPFLGWVTTRESERVKNLEVVLPDDVAAKVELIAQSRGIAVADLLAASVVEKLEREAAFVSAADYVLQKNADLYERLA